MDFNYLPSKPAPSHGYLKLIFYKIRLSISQLFKALYSRFLLCTSCLGSPFNPGQLFSQQILPFFLAGPFHLFPKELFLQEAIIVSVVFIESASIQLYRFIRNSLQKVSVMGYHEQCTFSLVEISFQIIYYVIIQMVGRLVEYQKIRGVYESGG
ncbi:hypothetical protein SDC9_110735 [bioreactor metagenome]|uniref:Uncharacterized protein n=1 Tax=bioreactor metagenome TaxID=1076179 RepID=A0A645BH19_9ZZZZ